MAAGNTAGAGSGQVRRVGKTSQNHFGSAKDFSTVGVGGGISEEAFEAKHGFGRRVGLL
jgi:hypothetical protein